MMQDLLCGNCILLGNRVHMPYSVNMKILIISNLYPPHVLGGYEILCAQVVDNLKARGHQVHVLTSDHGGGKSDQDVTRTLKVYQDFDKSASFMRSARIKTAIHNKKETLKILENNSFDVVFIWSLLRLTPASAHVVQKECIPAVYTFNDENITSFNYHPFSFSLKTAAHSLLDRLFPLTTVRKLDFSRTTCISRILKNNLLEKHLPINESKVIYQGIPIEKFPLKKGPVVLGQPAKILYVGQLHPYKGVHTIIEALKILEKKDGIKPCSLTIVGKGPKEYTQRLEKMAAEASCEIRLAGPVPHDELPSLYRGMDIFIFPSIWEEPFGLTHLEAMASGLPVISTANGGQGEFLVEGENALTFTPDDPENLCRQLERLLTDSSLYTKLAVNGRKTVEEHFYFDRYVDELEELLLSAVSH